MNETNTRKIEVAKNGFYAGGAFIGSRDKFKLAQIDGGPNSGHTGLFSLDGETLIGIVDEKSLAALNETDRPPTGGRIRYNADGSRKEYDPIRDAPGMSATQLSKFINARYPVEGWTNDVNLDAAIVQRMVESGCDFSTALRETTRDPEFAELWREHAAKCGVLLSE